MIDCFSREMQANADSDCDISEDDEFDSIEGATEGKEELQLNLRLERLKGIRGKAKPKFTFHSQRKEQSCSVICEDRLCSASISKVHSLSETFDAITSRTDKYPVSECLEDLVEEFEDQFDAGPALNCGNTESSIAELLDGLKDKNSSLGGVMNGQFGGRMLPIIENRALVVSRYRRADSEDSPISVDDESLSDHEANDQKLKLAVLCTKEQSITDRFEEALVAACMDAERTIGLMPNPLGIGLFGKLQRVMQSEKELEINFLNGLDCSTIPNGCIDVKILSRYLDAKLTVCSCLFIDMERSLLQNGDEFIATEDEKRTVIFSPRVCSNVELEVGNLIRINPPWKEVPVDDAHSIILSTYFTQLT
ncbi:uncharacterized protein LOC101205023 isoform X2 [Cucumis sativus]|uniref:uncharacterized protein LOC101205023 isoform X2 n=1 Tax=Cucumis sativus TaxID=3659 RepID=UPI0005EC633C|nr:uncharacterized protein LOC101205023 isoform X2 [Cucumis sativus]KAE8650493.1 hypothetical protein Csa_010124 [Cucumis sativus]